MRGDDLRRIVLDRAHAAGVGHVGSCLSVCDVLAVLFGAVLRGGAGEPDRDRFVMSKGHAALALYAALRLRGTLGDADLDGFCRDGGRLGVHPTVGVPGVDFATGSLGHGLAYGVGAALAGRLAGSSRAAYVLVSDAELDEGSTWEAAMLGAHHRVGRLVAVVDANGRQALGATRDVLDLEPLAPRWRAFGWDVVEVDGHDEGALRAALARPVADPAPPRVVLARTTFGRGVSFMEGRLEWHYLPTTPAQHAAAVAEVAAAARSRGPTPAVTPHGAAP